MDEEMTAYADKVRMHRAQLTEAVGVVDEALAHPIEHPHWRERVLVALAELANDFRQHRDLAEGEGGWYSRIVRDAPHLATKIERLRAEHEEVSATLADLLAALESGGPLTPAEDFRERATSLMGRLVRHRQLGADLTWAAYGWDLGGSG